MMNKSDTDRAKITLSINAKNVELLKELSKATRIPQSRLMDEAIELLLRKHQGEK